ncbi:hypothetical protein H5410_015436 [Solanum commersonii]|uniref:Uncharacterized protein n=1 Tax=Solanum commersonii TaxID=4109 RepID=A0A9J5ZUE5_SOLCO|nr:hypothetical protein H5410_015436 [Solanum commersonii]
MQVQAKPKCLNSLTQRMTPYSMIPYSHNGSQFKAPESDTTLTLIKKNTMHDFSHRFTRIFQLTISQRDAKSSHIVYTTSLGLIVAAHSCLFDYKNYLSHQDPSVKLVGIANPLGDPPFSLVSTHWNIRRGCRPFSDSPNGLGDC